MTLKQILEDYYKRRGLTWPTFDDALHFADTEKAEALEIYLARTDKYVRNNPDDKPKWSPDKFEEEMGDYLQMVQVAGMVMGVDPMGGLLRKLNRKTGCDYRIGDNVTLTSELKAKDKTRPRFMRVWLKGLLE